MYNQKKAPGRLENNKINPYQMDNKIAFSQLNPIRPKSRTIIPSRIPHPPMEIGITVASKTNGNILIHWIYEIFKSKARARKYNIPHVENSAAEATIKIWRTFLFKDTFLRVSDK